MHGPRDLQVLVADSAEARGVLEAHAGRDRHPSLGGTLRTQVRQFPKRSLTSQTEIERVESQGLVVERQLIRSEGKVFGL